MEIKIVGNECYGYGVNIYENGNCYKVRNTRSQYNPAPVFGCGKLSTIEEVKAKAEALKAQGFSAEYISLHTIG